MTKGSGQEAGTRTDGPDGASGQQKPSPGSPKPTPKQTSKADPKADPKPVSTPAPKPTKPVSKPAPAQVSTPVPTPTPVPTEAEGDDTAIRPALTKRIQAKLASAADEHRANAAAKAEANAATGSAATPAKQPEGSAPRPPRRARLRLTRIDPWSVMKTSFLLSIAFGVVTVVAVAMIWSVLDAAGVWDSINTTIQESVGGPETADLDVENYVGTSRVLGFTILVAALDVILITAIATLGAFLYNMSAALLGGVEMTLAEDQN